MQKIVRQDDLVIWTLNLSDVRKEVFIVPEDARGALLEDGALVETVIPNAKFAFKRNKHAASVELVLSSTLPVDMKWGVFDVPYSDYQSKLNAKCGLCGTISLKVFNTKSAFKALGKNVNAQQIQSASLNSAKMVIEEVLKDILNEDTFGRPDLSGEKKTRLIETIKNKLDNYFSNMGLSIGDVTINKLVVDEEYLAKRAEWETRKENERKMKDDLRNLEEIKDTLGGQQDNQPQVVIKEVTKCPRCGATLEPGVKFCPSCGQKLHN